MGKGQSGVVTCLGDSVSCQSQVTSQRVSFLTEQSFSVWKGPVTDWTCSSAAKVSFAWCDTHAYGLAEKTHGAQLHQVGALTPPRPQLINIAWPRVRKK